MNAPHTSDFARLLAFEDLSRAIEALRPTDDAPALAGLARPRLIDAIDMLEADGYVVSAPERAYPTAHLGHAEWRIHITRPDRVVGTLAFFIPEPPLKKG